MNAPDAHRLFDTHCHIDLFPDPAQVVDRAERDGVYTIAVTNAPSVFRATQELTSGSRFVRPAIGLHPELAKSHGHEIDRFWPLLHETRYVGEIGLDFVTANVQERAHQIKLLTQILERCARSGDKILTLHSRRAATAVIDAIGPTFPGHIILHWYSGSQRDLLRAAEYGFYFSINPQMASAKSSRALISKMPRDRILLETDGPFVVHGDRPAEPGDTRVVVDQLAHLWEMSPLETSNVLFKNFQRVLGPSTLQ